MQKATGLHKVFIPVVVLLLFISAYSIRIISINKDYDGILGLIRALIYLVLFIVWSLSMNRRIIQKPVKIYINAIAVSIILWLSLRTVKYNFAYGSCDIERILWYMFYIPILLMPLFFFFLSLSVGKPENYRISKKANLLYIPTIALIIMVLTNDFHNWVFVFPEGIINANHIYSYAPGYFAVCAWVALCFLFAIFLIVKKSCVSASKSILIMPFIPIVVAVVYGIMYILKIPLLLYLAGDMTIFFCLIAAAELEICIRCNIILSNTHYEELFKTSDINAVITDKDYNVYLLSEKAVAEDKETMREAYSKPVITKDNLRINSLEINAGYVLWEEDITQINEMLALLNENKENLKEYNRVLKEDYRVKAHIHSLIEQNRLYDTVQNQLRAHMEVLEVYIKEYASLETDEERKKLLSKIAIVGTYIKRRSNLIFIAEQNETLCIKELELCINESINNIKLLTDECVFLNDYNGNISSDSILKLYDMFEEFISKAFDVLYALYIHIYEKDNKLNMRILLSCDEKVNDIFSCSKYIKEEDEGEYLLSVSVSATGEIL